MILKKCLEIFLARVVDVSLGTIRTVLFVKGKTTEPFVIAFFEVLVWFMVAREALNTNFDKSFIAVSYALGYATGTLIGSKLSRILIKGNVGLQVVLKKDSKYIVDVIRKKGYGISVIKLKNNYKDNKDMLFIEVSDRRLKEVMKIINHYDKKAFIVINESKYVQNGLLK